jgi:glycosyltransferase involved in cell wall biosynthesis
VATAPQPRVSVVMLAFNHAEFVAQAIESVLMQRPPFPFELVIGEDCSSDRTREVVSSYAASHPELISTVFSQRNLGYGAMLRRVFAATRGELIAYLDGDDYWTSPTKLRRQADYLEWHPQCASCFHDVSLVYGSAGVPSGAVTPGLDEASFGLEDILKECFIPTTGMMFHREVAETLPVPSSEPGGWVDWPIHVHAAQRGPLGYIPEALAAYRVHDGGMFSSQDRISQLREDLRFYEQVSARLPEQRELIARCVENRHCQLAIERLGVPFDACVVLVDRRREIRPYFNGRHARGLPRRDGREVTELEAIRRAAVDLPPAVRDYGGTAMPSGRSAGCYVVVPADSSRWVAECSQLGDHLREQARVSCSGEWGSVHELPPFAGHRREGWRTTRRVDVSLPKPFADGIAGGHLEAPLPGVSLSAHAVAVSGWVLGAEQPARAIELSCGGEPLGWAPVQVERSDIVEAFPELEVGKPGFGTTINVQDLGEGGTVDLVVLLADGARVPFAELRFAEGR